MVVQDTFPLLPSPSLPSLPVPSLFTFGRCVTELCVKPCIGLINQLLKPFTQVAVISIVPLQRQGQVVALLLRLEGPATQLEAIQLDLRDWHLLQPVHP